MSEANTVDGNNKAVDEIMVVEVNGAKMEAYATFMPPINDGKVLTIEEIRALVKEKGIEFGLDQALFRDFEAGRRTYGKRYVIAKGLEPGTGEDGGIKYNFNTDKKTFRPKLLEDGSVDYREMDLIEMAEEGQLLARVIHHTKGEDGRNVFGEVIPGKEGKKAPKLPRGKNTVVSEDEMSLYSEANGQIIFLNNRISVNRILEIPGDVGVATGNIKFNGSVIVRGNVLTDYKINAMGNIEVRGLVEGAELISEGSIAISKGINGMNKAKVEARGNINALIIKDAKIVAGGDIYADGIMHCTVKCNGKLQVNGKKGLLVGGSITAKDEIEAKVIGSPMATATDISVGLDAEVYESYRNYMFELNTLQKEYEELSKTILSMSKIKELNNLPAAKRNSYIKTIYDAQAVKKRLETLQDEIIEIKGELDNYKYHGRVKATSIIHPGVHIQIGNAVLNIKDEAFHCLVINDDGRAKIVGL